MDHNCCNRKGQAVAHFWALQSLQIMHLAAKDILDAQIAVPEPIFQNNSLLATPK
jgi:hypothetical protein